MLKFSPLYVEATLVACIPITEIIYRSSSMYYPSPT